MFPLQNAHFSQIFDTDRSKGKAEPPGQKSLTNLELISNPPPRSTKSVIYKASVLPRPARIQKNSNPFSKQNGYVFKKI